MAKAGHADRATGVRPSASDVNDREPLASRCTRPIRDDAVPSGRAQRGVPPNEFTSATQLQRHTARARPEGRKSCSVQRRRERLTCDGARAGALRKYIETEFRRYLKVRFAHCGLARAALETWGDEAHIA
jgi:hypothetical protein